MKHIKINRLRISWDQMDQHFHPSSKIAGFHSRTNIHTLALCEAEKMSTERINNSTMRPAVTAGRPVSMAAVLKKNERFSLNAENKNNGFFTQFAMY